MKRLTDNISSQYIEAANRLRPNRARQRVVAYVESYDDVFFWRSVLDEFETDTLTFEVMLPSRTNLGKGKKNVLKNLCGDWRNEGDGTSADGTVSGMRKAESRGRSVSQDNLGRYLIACVDADYDYLMQGTTPISREIINNPFVFHTYVYAIENYQCYARGLHEVCVMSTLNDKQIVDFEAFMAEYSRIVWPLFVWNVWVYRYDLYSRFSLMDFGGLVGIRDINPYHPERTLEALRHTVNRKINWMQQHFPQGKKTYKPLRDELLAMGLTPETTYLYIQGHTLFENVVLPLLTPICTQLRKEREAEIRHYAMHAEQRQNELSCYQRRQSPIDQMLRKSTKFRESEVYEHLRADLRRFVEGLQKKEE